MTKPVCLPDNIKTEQGWSTEFTSWNMYDGTLEKDMLRIEYDAYCTRFTEVQDHKLCIRTKTCDGYPGTPLIWQDTNTDINHVVGIMSGNSEGCENELQRNRVGIMGKVEQSEILEFIKETKEGM